MRRRRFIVQALASSTALTVGWRWHDAMAQGAALPGSLAKQPLLDGWVRIAGDGRIGVFSGKAELGQGIKTALLQLAADELAVAPARITLTTADTDLTANEGYTAGSHSMQDSGTAIRHAAAQVREILLARAAQRFGVGTAALRLDDGAVHNGSQRIGYGELASGDVLHRPAQPQSVLRPKAMQRAIGRPMPRVDIPAKLTGGAAYVQDLRLPGMLHARVLRPPALQARLLRLDAAGVERLPGVVRVVRDGRFVAVVAQREFQAVQALRALAGAAQWDLPPATLPDAGALPAALHAAADEAHVILDRGSAGAPTLQAGYTRPYLMHGSIGPSCAVALLQGGRTTVWTHTQGVFPLRAALAELLHVAPDAVRCIHTEGSGCYGHNGADDVAADAALLAHALPGRPVRVQWMREDEHGWEPYGPPMTTRLAAALGADGRIASWQHEVWSNTHSSRPGAAGDLLAGRLVEAAFEPTPPKPLPLPEGGGDRNAIPLYTFPNARVVHHFLPAMPLRVSALRALGAYMNVFSIESFVDELAAAARADPVDFRLRHLDDPRARAVVQAAAERFGWTEFRRQGQHGRGFAFARYKNLAAYAAIACDVRVRRDTGEVVIGRVVAAVDSGEAVNPDGIRNQIEGGIVQSASWTLLEQVRFDHRQVTSVDWGGYPILRFAQLPQSVEVHLIDRPGEPFLGTGEAAQGPAAAALANAVADATGVRLRDLPLDRARVRAALAG